MARRYVVSALQGRPMLTQRPAATGSIRRGQMVPGRGLAGRGCGIVDDGRRGRSVSRRPAAARASGRDDASRGFAQDMSGSCWRVSDVNKSLELAGQTLEGDLDGQDARHSGSGRRCPAANTGDRLWAVMVGDEGAKSGAKVDSVAEYPYTDAGLRRVLSLVKTAPPMVPG